jgi:hypothetical protein
MSMTPMSADNLAEAIRELSTRIHEIEVRL